MPVDTQREDRVERRPDPLELITVTVTSPDRRISATVSDGDKVTLRFVTGTYRRYDERTLGHQLAQLATVAWVNYQKSYFKAFSAAAGQTLRGDDREYTPEGLAYKRGLAGLRCEGDSDERSVHLESVGLVHWQVEIGDGACRALTEAQFLAEVSSALRALLTDYYRQAEDLKDRIIAARSTTVSSRR
jgi:hypothetical protein